MTVTRIGNEILVNTITVSAQTNPRIITLANGSFVVAWEDGSGASGATTTGDLSSTGVKARVFSVDGAPIGNEFLVNTTTDNAQASIRMTALANGGFVVTWEDFSDGFGGSIKAQVFTSNGTPVGIEIPDNTGTTADEREQQITALSNGGFVVTWRSQAFPNVDIAAQVYAADGSKVGGEIIVNTATANGQFSPQITALANGGFVVTWEDDSRGIGGATGDTSGSAVKAQVFAADGVKLGGEILVNTATSSTQFQSQITALSNGGFVVSWDDFSLGVGGATGDTSVGAVKAQVFTQDGARVGSEILVNTVTSQAQSQNRITALNNGGFVVAWEDQSGFAAGAAGDTSQGAIRAQVFDSQGGRAGSEILVNTATENTQFLPQITALSDGGFVVVWEDNSEGLGGATGDASLSAVKAQVFDSGGNKNGSEILVNTATFGEQSVPHVTAMPNGRFAVTWADNSIGIGGTGGDTSSLAIKAQVFEVTTTNPPVNAAPTAVTLVPVQDTIAENTAIGGGINVANIAVSDDGQGVNTLGLTGADAASFAIRNGNQLFYVGTSPDFETKRSFEVAVTVDDQTLGAGIELTSAPFTLNVGNVVNVALTNAVTFLTLEQQETNTITIDGIAGFVRVADIVLTEEGPGTSLQTTGSGNTFFRIGPANGLYLSSALFEGFDASEGPVAVQADDPATGAGVDATSNAISVSMETRPFARSDEFLVIAGSEHTFPASAGVLANDVDEDGDPITAALIAGPPGGTYFYDESGNRVFDPNSSVALAPDGSLTVLVEPYPDQVPGVTYATYFSYVAVDVDGNLSSPAEVEIAYQVGGDDDEDAEDPNDPAFPGGNGGGGGGNGGGSNPAFPGGPDLPAGPGGPGGGASNGSGFGYGDIHVITFDGLTYDMQAEGEFVAARSTSGSPFELQVRTDATWNGFVSLATAVATSIDGRKVSFDALTDTLRVDDAVVSIAPNSQLAVGGGAVHQGNAGNYAFTYGDDQQVVYLYDVGPALNYSIFATPARIATTVGLMDDDAGVLLRADGTPVPGNPTYAEFYADANSFVNSWRITDATSLFTYGPGENTATFTDLTKPLQSLSIADLPANLVAAAAERVEAAGITDPALRESAILDLVLTGDPRILSGSQQAKVPTATLDVQGAPLPKLVGIGADTLARAEGNAGSTEFTFTVYRTNGLGTLSVDYAVTTEGFNITAPTAASDFVGGVLPTGNVTFADGETLQSITISVQGETTLENNEQFAVALANISSPDFGLLHPSIMALIEDDDARAPTMLAERFTGNQGQTIGGNVLANDTGNNGETLAARLVAGPDNGTLALGADGSFTYTPGAAFAGTDSFTFRAFDSFSTSPLQIVQIVVGGTNGGSNSAPTLSAVSTPADIAEADDASAQVVAASGTLTVSDPDAGNRLTATALAPVVELNGAPVPAEFAGQIAALSAASALRLGAPIIANGSPQTIGWTYEAGAADLDFLAAGDVLTIRYGVRVGDGSATSAVLPIVITIVGTDDAPPNSAPVADDDSFTLAEDGVLRIAAPGVLEGDTDIDGDPLTAAVVSGPANGTLTFNTDGSFSYTPASNFNGTDSFTYRANDGTVDSNIATVGITVTPVNDAPVADDDSFTVADNGVLNVATRGVLDGDTDTDGDPLTAVLDSKAANGSISLNADGSFTYTPNVNFIGTDSFTYRASDGAVSSKLATVSITVTAPPGFNVITGTNVGGTTNGTSRADLITPADGADLVLAGSGNDVIRATVGDGNDVYYGGPGSDTVDYAALTQGVTVTLTSLFGISAGLVTGAQSGTDVLGSIENVIGSQAADTIRGNSLANRIEGGRGNDALTGGGGPDTFVFAPGFGNDTVTDFASGPGLVDVMQLSMGTEFDTLAEVMAAASQVGADTVITFDAATSITLQNVQKAALAADDFRFA